MNIHQDDVSCADGVLVASGHKSCRQDAGGRAWRSSQSAASTGWWATIVLVHGEVTYVSTCVGPTPQMNTRSGNPTTSCHVSAQLSIVRESSRLAAHRKVKGEEVYTLGEATVGGLRRLLTQLGAGIGGPAFAVVHCVVAFRFPTTFR